MSSRNETNSCPGCKRIPFRLSALKKHVPDEVGVYGFWYGQYCIYVGKTEGQTLKKRLTDHWKGSHNIDLQLWIDSKGAKLQVAFVEIENKKQISRYERYYIRFFQPLTNKILYK